jgi:hypothetical protein
MGLHSGRDFNVVFVDRMIMMSGRVHVHHNGAGGGADRYGSLVIFIHTK